MRAPDDRCRPAGRRAAYRRRTSPDRFRRPAPPAPCVRAAAPYCGKIDERAAAEILDDRNAGAPAELARAPRAARIVRRSLRCDSSRGGCAAAAPCAARARARNPRYRRDWSCRPRPASRRCVRARRECESRRRSRRAGCARRRPRGPSAKVSSTSSTAAAQLLTTSASCAPVTSRSSSVDRRIARAALAGRKIVLEIR